MLLFTPEAVAWIAEHWEIAVTLAGLFAAGFAGYFFLRANKDQSVHETQTKSITALETLVKTRDAEIKELECNAEASAVELQKVQTELESVRGEYKIVGAIILSDLIKFQGRRDDILAEMEVLRSEKHILELKVKRLERVAADK